MSNFQKEKKKAIHEYLQKKCIFFRSGSFDAINSSPAACRLASHKREDQEQEYLQQKICIRSGSFKARPTSCGLASHKREQDQEQEQAIPFYQPSPVPDFLEAFAVDF